MENHAINAWLQQVFTEPVQHVSLHFDALRVDTARQADQAAFKEECEKAILDQTGFRVELVNKATNRLNLRGR